MKFNRKSIKNLGYFVNILHEDVDVTSQILGIRVSFRWRPIINDELKKTILEYAHPLQTELPLAVLMSNLNILEFRK